jgi:hypothetical protein
VLIYHAHELRYQKNIAGVRRCSKRNFTSHNFFARDVPKKSLFCKGKRWKVWNLYFFFDFRKIIGRTKNFKKYTSAAGVKSLPPWGTAAGEHLWHKAAWHGSRPTAAGPYRRARGGKAIFIFIFFIFKTLLTF